MIDGRDGGITVATLISDTDLQNSSALPIIAWMLKVNETNKCVKSEVIYSQKLRTNISRITHRT